MSPSGQGFMEKYWKAMLAVLAIIGLFAWLICTNYRDPKKVRRTVKSFAHSGAAVCPSPDSLSDTTQVRACVNSLSFDTVASVGDEQRLLVRVPLDSGAVCHGDPTHGCRHGPLAKIEPVIGADERSASAIDQGIIIARLFLRDSSESYPKLNLAPGDTTYWWVRRLSADSATSKYLRISHGQVLETPLDTIMIAHHPEEEYMMSLARFIWDDGDEKTQGTCQPGSCCH
jgi:hypothetical protein